MLAFPKTGTDLADILAGYQLCARAEGKRPSTIATVTSSVSYLRSIRAFWSWIVSEDIVDASPFSRVKVPRVSSHVMRHTAAITFLRNKGDVSSPCSGCWGTAAGDD